MNRNKIITLEALILTIAISIGLATTIYSQSTHKNNTILAIFKDTLLGTIDTNIKQIAINIAEQEVREIIAKDSLITLASGKDTIWTFDITLAGRRYLGTVFSGPVLTGVVKGNITDNLIYLYSPADVSGFSQRHVLYELD